MLILCCTSVWLMQQHNYLSTNHKQSNVNTSYSAYICFIFCMKYFCTIIYAEFYEIYKARFKILSLVFRSEMPKHFLDFIIIILLTTLGLLTLYTCLLCMIVYDVSNLYYHIDIMMYPSNYDNELIFVLDSMILFAVTHNGYIH